MDIKVLGTGCSKCRTLKERVCQTLSVLEIDAEVQEVKDINKIMEYDVFITPALLINGKVKASGRVPSSEEIKAWLLEE
jgi:small redox-active disulfide protein 2